MKNNPSESEPREDKKISIDKWVDQKRPVRKSFDGPSGIEIPLRISFDRQAYAEIVVHAKESLDAEICGVLVGQVCQDNESLFVDVQSAIRGQAAHQEKTHVTFTQETWEIIHKQKDEQYPKLQIVGWYHSHPGFGVQVSEMDRFIHKNFFSSETQIGLITDPLNGQVAVFINADQGIQYLSRFWIHGRECKCNTPDRKATDAESGNSTMASELSEAIERVNTRLSQSIQAMDDFRNLIFKFLTTLGFILCLGITLTFGYHIYHSYTSDFTPPEMVQYVPVPVKIGDQTVMLGVAIAKWDVPPELNSIYLQIEQATREQEKQAAEKAKIKQNQEKTEQKNQDNKSLPNKP